jgi:uncharacterized membrane protein YedE/YeeE
MHRHREAVMENFTPVSAFLGGVMIGLAAVLLLLANGRIAGVSGILGGLLACEPREIGWRLAFILGLVAGPLLLAAVLGGPPPVRVASSPGLLVAGGCWSATARGSAAAAPAGTAYAAWPACRRARWSPPASSSRRGSPPCSSPAT